MKEGTLLFNHSVMNAGKSNKLLENNFSLRAIGRKTVLVKPALDTRDEYIKSRNGLSEKCLNIKEDESFYQLLNPDDFDAILVDEAQFLTEKQAYELREIATNFDKLIFCFGLRTDFQGHLFKSSAVLLALSDVLEESSTFCHCGNKATMVLKYDAMTRKVIKEGDIIDCGAEDKYLSVCYKHWHLGDLGKVSWK